MKVITPDTVDRVAFRLFWRLSRVSDTEAVAQEKWSQLKRESRLQYSHYVFLAKFVLEEE